MEIELLTSMPIKQVLNQLSHFMSWQIFWTHTYKHVQIFFAHPNFEMHFYFDIFFNNINESIFPRTFKNIFMKLDIIYKYSDHLWGFLKIQIVFTNLICCYSFQSCSIEIREKLIMYKSFTNLLCAQRALIFLMLWKIQIKFEWKKCVHDVI